MSQHLLPLYTMQHFTSFFYKFNSSLLTKGDFFFLLNAGFAMAILDLISRVHLASFVIMLYKQLKYSTFSSRF